MKEELWNNTSRKLIFIFVSIINGRQHFNDIRDIYQLPSMEWTKGYIRELGTKSRDRQDLRLWEVKLSQVSSNRKNILLKYKKLPDFMRSIVKHSI